MRSAISILLLLSAAPATAQNPDSVRQPKGDAYVRAVAAGYKAAFLCGGVFNAGRTERSVESLDLKGIYPDYADIVPTLPARVDRRGATVSVSVSFDPALPPRRATWRAGAGCTLAPIGATPATPAAMRAPAALGADPRAWPMGDGGIAPNPSPALAKVVGDAFGNRFGARAETLGVVVLRNGQVVAERYRDGFGPFAGNRTWSVAKSIAGTLVGYAGIDPRLPATVPEWRAPGDPRARLTTDHLLRMASGLHSDTAGNRTDAEYFGGTAVTEQATGWPLEALPNTRFRYANNDILLAVRAMRARLGETRYRALPNQLFAALGMRHTVAQSDWRGHYLLSSDVWTTARDLSRLGQFWLQDGVWQGRRMLPAGWMRYMTTPAGPQPDRAEGYGATLWLFGEKQGLPVGSYSAQGNRGQFVMVVPSQRLVVVRRGEDPMSARFDIARFTAEVIAADRP